HPRPNLQLAEVLQEQALHGSHQEQSHPLCWHNKPSDESIRQRDGERRLYGLWVHRLHSISLARFPRSSRYGATCSIERGTANRWNKIHDLPRRRLLSPERPRQSMRNDGRTGLWARICNRTAIQDTLVDREVTRCRIPACHDKQKIQTMADKWCLHNRQNGNPTQGHGEAYRILLRR